VEFGAAEVRRHQQLYSQAIALDQFYESLKEEPPKEPELPPAPEKPVVDGTTCLACNKKFPSLESLEKHLKLSEQHKINVGKTFVPAAAAAPAPAIAPASAAQTVRKVVSLCVRCYFADKQNKAGLGLGAQDSGVPDMSDRSVSYKDRGYLATLARFKRQ
jgi:hypothetical protein